MAHSRPESTRAGAVREEQLATAEQGNGLRNLGWKKNYRPRNVVVTAVDGGSERHHMHERGRSGGQDRMGLRCSCHYWARKYNFYFFSIMGALYFKKQFHPASA
jgi:hypothetical protein